MDAKEAAETAKFKSETRINRVKFYAAVIGIPLAIFGANNEYGKYRDAEEARRVEAVRQQIEAVRQQIEKRKLNLTSQTLDIFAQLADDNDTNDIQAAFLLRGLELPALPFIAGAIGDPRYAELQRSFFESYLAIASGETYNLVLTEVKPNAPEAARILTEALNRNWHTFLQAEESVPSPQSTITPYIDLIDLWLDDITLSKDALIEDKDLVGLLAKIHGSFGPKLKKCNVSTYSAQCTVLKGKIGGVLSDLDYNISAGEPAASTDDSEQGGGEIP